MEAGGDEHSPPAPRRFVAILASITAAATITEEFVNWFSFVHGRSNSPARNLPPVGCMPVEHVSAPEQRMTWSCPSLMP
jgi:hypothetical protein